MPETYSISSLTENQLISAQQFLERVFHQEQNIPAELIPVTAEEQHWWCITKNNEILGTVAAWKTGNEWHWGRLAIDTRLRGKGLGKKLVTQSLQELFNQSIDKIFIDARDITVNMIVKLGGEAIGERSMFYGYPITPMVIEKQKFTLV